MCDLVAPLLVIFDDGEYIVILQRFNVKITNYGWVVHYSFTEAKTYSCFCELMKRMSANFPHGGAMDSHFANMRSLIQVSCSSCVNVIIPRTWNIIN